MPKPHEANKSSRDDEIAAAVTEFRRTQIEHPMMKRTLHEVLAAISRTAGPRIVLVVGATGVGKTTLANQIYTCVKRRYDAQIKADRNLLPIVGVTAASPHGAAFSWKDFYTRMLKRTPHPLADRLLPPRMQQLFEDELIVTQADQLPPDPLRRAIESILRERKTKVLLIDEAHHILMCRDPRLLEFQFEAIKSLSNETNVTIVLFGTYRLLDICHQSAQLVRRSEVIHFRRYSGISGTETHEFRDFLHDLTPHIHLRQQRPLVSEAEYYFTKSAGCCGILKDWLAKVYEAALVDGVRRIDADFAETYSIPNRDLKTIIDDAKAGEARLDDIALIELKRMLMPGLYPSSGDSQTAAARGRAGVLARRPGRRVGQRNPKRDPVGPEHGEDGQTTRA